MEEKLNWPPEEAWRSWIAEEREAYIVTCLRRGVSVDETGWDAHLQVVSFSYLERALALEAHRRDPSGESIGRYNAAVDELRGNLERFRLDDSDAPT